ncbi:MAG: phenylacetic acid degradation bifunctional protein PaaZ [Crocinitomicaceae bacterium]|jgi:oxepin-CoA hydrolase / 3-oxo-5,6-dehydrosuberyl-CoA semialdehyde dehydrogenase|nr:phenylacetic acid degradation bifunctional protein PaaZ [Crocinitomicaceae bacterium]MDP4723796.1 phenylacetic acid degradation bifunctional protein PaaZ [Crocinitomicaceae bacterium]MDP4739436.1 phenylacetic acid degradation bifunctional protein PaaZ [Crocinitomicaceae bacterium]MDP4805955.1 phenylacetic acid degradation bifunctional protein PaaZ [Crocinitomicaceae bacterium]MDP4867909.1 phenylacetic acid degradation bifunctional protein PaaZ [Crocinitomicaceae bacterium]
MQRFQNYVLGQWLDGQGEETPLFNALTGAQIGAVSSAGLDFAEVLTYARQKGYALRKMTFQERGRMLKALALFLMERKAKYYEISALTGATKVDSWIDIEGGIGNLFANASLRRQFPDLPYYVDGTAAPLSKNGSFIGHHIMVPKEGVAVHINAFNFPIWGMLEKIAVNLMAGVPAVVKPSEYTCFLTEVMVRDIIDSKILPEGALQLICGLGRGILDSVDARDVVTFTGSAATGKLLKGLPRISEQSVSFNLEADSLNATVLGQAAVPGTEEFDLFVKECVKEMTIKAGQKCTAVRRIIVPENLLDEVQGAIAARLATTKIGDPATEGVRMGALATKLQVERVRANVDLLAQSQQMVFGNLDDFEVLGASKEAGAFFPPVLFRNENPFTATAVHDIEAFGPVATIMPYKDMEAAIELAKMGKGSLVSSIVTPSNTEAVEYVVGAASMHGRILVLNKDCAKESTGHGSPMPLLTHGGPGRAGGGEEMGGKRGVLHYLQRTAIQGHPSTITAITQQFQVGSAMPEAQPHVFRKHFEELVVGETVFTHKHTVTDADIVNFANVSGDNFYAHMDATSLEGTIFERRVAHGYFILSKAAGLFVDPKKGPVLLNYGIEEARFTKPVYPGATIGVRFTVKEKIDQEKRSEEDIAKGIVKFLVDVYDETGETVALATILTMVKKLTDA